LTVTVLDASVVLKWFSRSPESGDAAARALRDQFVAGQLDAVVPRLLLLEVLNIAGRRWSWPADDVTTLADALAALPWRVSDPPLDLIATWVGRGLTAYDATYVALAESLDGVVVTDDKRLLDIAGDLARPLDG
jgi:predicted nucleic acid-binding protein